MGVFDALLGTFYNDGSELELGAGVDVKRGVVASRNASTRRVELGLEQDVTTAGSYDTPDSIEVDGYGRVTSVSSGVDARKWNALTEGTDYTGTAVAGLLTYDITMLSDLTERLPGGIPIRVLDLYGVPRYDTGGQIGTCENMTGITSSVVDSRGRIFVSVVDDGAGARHLDIYNRESRAASSLIGHTASYGAAGLQTVIEDNDSGIGGSINVLAVGAASTSIVVEMYRWLASAGATSTTLSLMGAGLSTGAGNIAELWIGAPWLATSFDCFVEGDFSTAATSRLLLDNVHRKKRWTPPPARIVLVMAWCYAVNGGGAPDVDLLVYDNTTAAWVPVTGGITMGAAQNDEFGIPQLDATELVTGSEIEVSTTLAAAGDTDLNLIVWVVRE